LAAAHGREQPDFLSHRPGSQDRYVPNVACLHRLSVFGLATRPYGFPFAPVVGRKTICIERLFVKQTFGKIALWYRDGTLMDYDGYDGL
jgi:hypothetical protein